MAKKPLIFVGIEGKLPYPLPKRGFILSEHQAILPFGTVRRKENDYVKAIDIALQLKNGQRKVFVVEKAVEFDVKSPAFDWNEIVPTEFQDLKCNQIQISPTIASTYQKYFDFDTQPKITLLQQPKKNKQRLRGLSSSYGEMVGRQENLDELKEILEQSFEDRGQIASIVGDGGLGKTRLWVEFEKYLENEHILYFFSSFSQQNKTNYSAFRELLIQIVEHFKLLLQLTDPEQHVLNYILYPEQENVFIKSLSQTDLDQNIHHLAQTLLEQLATEKIAFILDDIHWADKKSRLLIEHIVTNIPKRKHMWLLIHRYDYIPPFNKKLFYHQIPLQALNADQVEIQIKNMLQFKYIAPTTLRQIHEHSKGNPFFVEEIFRHSLENNLIQKGDDILRDLPLQQSDIPMNIQAMVQTRLDNLKPTVFRSLKKLSVFGSEMHRDEVISFLNQHEGNGEEIISILLQESYLSEISAFPEDKIGFYHDIIFETLHANNISKKERQEYHTSIAEFLLTFYKSERDFNKHIFRICDHLTHIPYDRTYQALFEKASTLAIQQNSFTLTEKYLSHLFNNNDLDKKNYVEYARALNNTDHINKLNDFIEHWGKTATVKTEDPNNGYYYTLMTFLRQQARFPQLKKIGAEAIDEYRKEYSDRELNSLITHYASALALRHQWGEYIHVSLKQIRLFNEDTASIEKILYLSGLASFTQNKTDKNSKLSLDLINKAMVILDNNPNTPYYEQNNILSRYAFFQTVQRCNYSFSATIWEKIIEIRKQNGIFSDLDNSHGALMTSNFFAGQYDKSLQSYNRIKELTQQHRTRHYYYITFWASLVYLVLGKIEKFKTLTIEARKGHHREPWFRTIRFYCMAHFHIQKKNYYNAYISFKRLLKLYQKMKTELVVADTGLLMSCAKAEHYGSISEADLPSIQKWIQTECHNQSYNHWSFQMHALTLARFTDADFGIDPYAVVPADCPNAFLKQKMYVEKIKLLDHKKMHAQADQLRQEYTAYRKKLELNIPYEHLQSFRNTPLFPVPEKP